MENKYSIKINNLFSKYKGLPNDDIFGIIIKEYILIEYLQESIDKFLKLDNIKCIFNKSIRRDGKTYLFGSFCTEEEIIKILNMKEFW